MAGKQKILLSLKYQNNEEQVYGNVDQGRIVAHPIPDFRHKNRGL